MNPPSFVPIDMTRIRARVGRAVGLSSCAIVAVAALAGRVHAQAQFTARLTTAQEVPPVSGTGKGTGTFTLTSAGLQFVVTVEGLTGPITEGHFHRGATGVGAGPVLRHLTTEFGSDNTAIGLWSPSDDEPLTPAIIADLLNGNVYINVHTSANLGGEIRGQVVLSGGTHFTANLTGQQENPAVAGSGIGTGSFVLTEDGTLQYRITATGLTGPITGAHLHTGGIGQNGGIAADLGSSFTGATAVGSVALTSAQRLDLLGGRSYVNLQTTANGGGEIRGQLVLDSGFGLSARLAGGQEVPSNGSTGTATAAMTWTPSGLLLDLTANGLSGAITDAHIHRGAPGVPGPAVRTLTPEFAGTTCQAVWRTDDAEPLAPSLLADLLAGNLYVDLHTAAFPGGQIRGQIVLGYPSPTPTSSFTARLTGSQEVPPLAVAGLGAGWFRYTAAGLEYSVTVNGLTGGITASHFSDRAIGANGSVVKDIVFVNGTASGVWAPGDAQALTPALVTELFRGNLYLNLHTGANPGGEIRGQVLPASGAGFMAMITGKEESPTSSATGLGTGSFTLTPVGLTFAITATGLTGAITAADFRQGAVGTSGAVARDITAELAAGGTDGGVWTTTDGQPLTSGLVTALFNEQLYVNLRTAANPGGEIRGQLRLVGGVGHRAALTGAAAVPPVGAFATGTAAMTSTDQGLAFRVTSSGLSGAITGAHFHDAPFGANGPIVRDVTAELADGGDGGVWKTSDGGPWTAAMAGELENDRLYLDLHTAANPDGEIRGQTRTPSIAAVDPPAHGGGALELAIFPNPATRVVRFAFHLPRESAVDLGVFDLQGRKVASVARGDYAAGAHIVRFDATGLATGLYLYRLEAAGLRRAGKMLLISN